MTQETPWNPKVAARLIQHLPGNGTVLDAGCGYLTYSNLLRNHVDRLVGLDIADLDVSGVPKEDFLVGTMESLPFRDSSFDFAYSLSVFQFIRDEGAAIGELHRVLRPRGKLLLTLPTSRSMFRLLRDLEIGFGVYKYPRFNVASHRYYSRDGIRKLMSERFKLIDVSGYDCNFVPRLGAFGIALIGRFPVVRRLWNRVPKKSNNPWRATSKPVCVGTEAHIKAGRLGGPAKSLLSRLRFISDLSYHYIVVLEKIPDATRFSGGPTM